MLPLISLRLLFFIYFSLYSDKISPPRSFFPSSCLLKIWVCVCVFSSSRRGAVHRDGQQLPRERASHLQEFGSRSLAEDRELFEVASRWVKPQQVGGGRRDPGRWSWCRGFYDDHIANSFINNPWINTVIKVYIRNKSKLVFRPSELHSFLKYQVPLNAHLCKIWRFEKERATPSGYIWDRRVHLPLPSSPVNYHGLWTQIWIILFFLEHLN